LDPGVVGTLLWELILWYNVQYVLIVGRVAILEIKTINDWNQSPEKIPEKFLLCVIAGKTLSA
jgi:hypothetical protein